MAEKADVFANYAIISNTESAANTLTFKKLETGISLNEKVAWVIARLEYVLSGLGATIFNATGDVLSFGLSVSNSFTIPDPTENTIIDYNSIERIDLGAAASGFFSVRPMIKDFSMLPGGGILVPPTPLYSFIRGVGLTAACSMVTRIHYTMRKLAVDEYWELVEARRVLES